MANNPTPRNYLPGTAGNIVSAVNLVYDPTVVMPNGTIGGMRPFNTSTDVGGAVSVSGLNVQVGAVAITGNPSVTISNPILAVSGNFGAGGGGGGGLVTGAGGFFGITGTVATTITNSPSVSLIGTPLVVNSGGYVGITGSVSTTITNTPTVTIGNPILPVSGVLAVTIGNIAVTGGSINLAGTPNVSIVGYSQELALLSGISGALTTNIGAAANVTGTVYTINQTEWALLSGISGALTANLSSPVYVTGTVTTIVTGTVNSSITNPIGVTGTAMDTNSAYTGVGLPLYPFQPVGGRAVNVTGAGTLAAYVTGTNVEFAFNAANGGLLTNQGCLDQSQDNVTSWVASSGSVSNTAVSGAAQMVLAANTNRRGWFLGNIGTGAMGVLLGGSNIGTGNLSFILKGGSANYDGNGASWSDMPAVFNGSVFVSGINGVPILYTAWQV